MPRLTARYEAELPLPVLLQADRLSDAKFSQPVFDDGRLSFQITIDDFDVLLTVQPHDGGWTRQPDGRLLLGAYDCTVEVSRDETQEVPDVIVNPKGGRDFTPRTPYFQERAPAYGAVAKTCLARFLTFIRFQLGQPLIWGTGDSPPRVIRSTTWLDPQGEPIDPGLQVLSALPIGLRDKEWRVDPLTASDEPSLRAALQAERVVPLHRLIVAQGKDAAVEGDLRRAVTELAIASEIAVKQAFFAPASAAGEAFEYFEDKNLLKAGVIDLLKEPARRAFGETFQDHDSNGFQDLKDMFRCRNKVVHRGQLTFRDDSGLAHTADQAVVRRWLGAVMSLFSWLEARADLPRFA